MEPTRYDALKQLRDHIPRLADALKIGNDEEIRFWQDIVDAKCSIPWWGSILLRPAARQD